jgi:hypothetical protein
MCQSCQQQQQQQQQQQRQQQQQHQHHELMLQHAKATALPFAAEQHAAIFK